MTVELDHVTIRYGDRVAVHDLTVAFGDGAVGLLGRNGAGKSSILKALLGLVPVEGGTMRFGGLPTTASAAAIRSHVGYMPERDAYLPQASGFEMVAMLGMLSGMPRRDAWRRAHEVLHLVGLDEQRYRPVAGYSSGTRQKVKLASALVHDPHVLFLDEPTNGLDPPGRRDMLQLVRQLSRDLGKSIVFSTHILPDVEAVCGSAVVLERGRVVAKGSLAELTAGGERQHSLAVDDAASAVLDRLQAVGRVRDDGGGRFTIWLRDGADIRGIHAAVAAAGGAVRSLVPHRRSLEDAFLQAVASAAPPGEVGR